MTSVLNLTQGTQVNTTGTGYQMAQSVATLADGGYVIAWQSMESDNSWGIYSQRYDAQGHKIGGETHVNTFVGNTQMTPTVAALNGGGYVVAWVSNGQDGSSVGVFAQCYDSQGHAQGAEFGVNSITNSHQYGQQVTGLADGGFVVVWHCANPATGDFEIHSQRYLGDGTMVSGETTVTTYATTSNFGPTVMAQPDGSYIVAWPGYVDGKWGIYQQAYDTGNDKLGGLVRVDSASGGNLATPQGATLADGGYVLSWTDSAGKGSDNAIMAQRFDADGHKLGAVFRVNTLNDGDESRQSICALDDGGFVIAWYTDNHGSSLDGTYLQRYDAQGHAIGPEMKAGPGSFVGAPQVSALSDGGFVLTYLATDGNFSGVFQKIFSPTVSLNGTQYLFGTVDSDDLDGGAGADVMYGGHGDDIYHVNSTGDVVGEQAGQGDDTVISTVTYTLGADVETLILGGSAAILGSGNASNNLIVGNDRANYIAGMNGDDDLRGAGGNDNMDGGIGDDQLSGGDGNDILYGASGSDDLNGDAGRDTLYASEGVDFINGGADQDTLAFVFINNGVAASLANGRAVYDGGTAFITNVENLQGSQYNDTLSGDSGNNVLDGSLGADNLRGGAGDDSYFVDVAGDVVSEYWLGGDAGGEDTVFSQVNYTLGAFLENLVLMDGARNGSGNTLDNMLTGNAANNILNGLGGADRMIGGYGNDTYYVDDAGDVAIESFGEGTDTVRSSVSLTLGANLESLFLLGDTALNGTGNDLNNTLTGGAGANRLNGMGGNDLLDGGAGADTMYGGAGNDTYYVDNAGDAVSEAYGGTDNGGADLIQASVSVRLGNYIERLQLTGSNNIDGTGNSLNNLIYGNDGSNILNGGAGNDQLTGGLGADVFQFSAACRGDIIKDFNSAEGDVIQLSGLGAYVINTSGANVTVDFGGGNVITVMNATSADVASHVIA